MLLLLLLGGGMPPKDETGPQENAVNCRPSLSPHSTPPPAALWDTILCRQVTLPEARCFYGFQIAMEAVHTEM